MKKIINPCKCDTGRTYKSNAFAEITYKDGKLSIHGVVGPMRNGNCKGSCGQCVDEIRTGTPTEDWTAEMLQKFCDIWERWHLNDMLPYCEHQRELGWDELATKAVNIYHFKLRQTIVSRQSAIKKDSLEALKLGREVRLSVDDRMILNLPYSIESPTELLDWPKDSYYEPMKPLYRGDQGHVEVKTLGWLRPDEHPDGILTKPCPVCGYKYGSSWRKEDVPQEVIDWLFSLPETKINPAWV